MTREARGREREKRGKEGEGGGREGERERENMRSTVSSHRGSDARKEHVDVERDQSATARGRRCGRGRSCLVICVDDGIRQQRQEH